MSTSPSDRNNLAPVDIGRRFWQPYINRVFRMQDHDLPRGVGSGGDLNPNLSHGYFNAEGQAQRGIAAGDSYGQGKRGQMNALPTPQALIRMITGVGDPPQGR